MASNLSTIGFAFGDDSEFNTAMTRLAGQTSRRHGTEGDGYTVWRSATGAELWFHLNAETHEITGLTPFFEGESDVSLKVIERVTRPRDTSFDGALMAWVAPDEDGVGVYPLVFDAVDFLALSGRKLPAVWRARLAGFADQVRAFPSAEDYEAGQTSEPRFAAQSFIPVGMFAVAATELESPAVPSSTALLTGRVAEHRLLTNEITGQRFHWVFVESLETAYDIVADPGVIDGTVVKGGTVEVSCWLFGRVLD
jgi:hypothetical protein